MIKRLIACKGHSIVVDYKTNSDIILYAKGILDDVLPETDMIVVKSPEKVWYIKISLIQAMRVDDTNDQPE